MAQWRRFTFFDKEVIHLEIQGANAICSSGGNDCLIIGDNKGGITIVDRSLERKSFRPFARHVSHIQQIDNWKVFAAVGDGLDPRPSHEQEERSHEKYKLPPPEDTDGNKTFVKIFRLDRTDRDGNPVCVQSIEVFAKLSPKPVTAFRVMDDLSLLAVGLGNGDVILFRSAHRNASGASRQLQPVILRPSSSSSASSSSSSGNPVTALGFCQVPLSGRGHSTVSASAKVDGLAQVHLYVVSLNSVTSYQCQLDVPPGSDPPLPRPVALDESGAPPRCAAVNEQGELGVAQDDAVYFFTPEARGGCIAFDRRKCYLTFTKQYLVLVHADPRERQVVTVADLRHRFIAFTFTLSAISLISHGQSVPGPESSSSSSPPTSAPGSSARLSGSYPNTGSGTEEVRHICSQWDSVFIFTSYGQVYRLTEKDTAAKLESLYRKNLYSIAIPLAYSANYPLPAIMDIFRMYGDHLYHKGDWDGAVTQYIRTIGHVEPSYVIMRYLDAQKIHNLTTYLEELHDKGLANADHTTLLLNCYTKLKAVEKLNHFIGFNPSYADGDSGAHSNPKTKDRSASTASTSSMSSGFTAPSGAKWKARKGTEKDGKGGTQSRGLRTAKFDVETAISVLRTTFKEQALFLAKEHGQHSWYFRIRLEDVVDSGRGSDGEENRQTMRSVREALEHIQTLPFEEAEKNLKLYGSTLVAHLPKETTELLKLLCTGRYKPIAGSRGTSSDKTSLLNGMDSAEAEKGKKSDPEQFIHLYASHSDELRDLLEAVVREEPQTSSQVGNTLVELLLRDYKSAQDALEAARQRAKFGHADHKSPVEDAEGDGDGDQHGRGLSGMGHKDSADTNGDLDGDKAQRARPSVEELEARLQEKEDAVMAFLDSPTAKYDPNHALILVSGSHLKRGQLYLYGKLHMYYMVVQQYMEVGDNRSIVEEAKKHGDKDPNIWVQVLHHLADRANQEGRRQELQDDQTNKEAEAAGADKDRAKASGASTSSNNNNNSKEGNGSNGYKGTQDGVAQDAGAPQAWDALGEVLEYIETSGVLPALQVVQILGQFPYIPLSRIKNFLAARLQAEAEAVAADSEEIEKLRDDTEKMRRETEEMEKKAMVFQATKCDLCKRDLDLPAVHFWCGHAYHQNCLPEIERECLHCAAEHRHVLELQRSLEEKSHDHERFYHELETSADRFKTVAEYFGLGVFGSSHRTSDSTT